MKKRDLLAFAMICVSAALLVGACQGNPQGAQGQGGMMGPAGQQSFQQVLNPDAQRKFNELDQRSQQMVIDQVNQGTDPNTAVNNVYNQSRQGGAQGGQGPQGGRPPAPGARPIPPGQTGAQSRNY